MIWFAIRCSRQTLPTFATAGLGKNRMRSSRSSRDKLRALNRVPHFPTQLSQLVAKRVSALEVLGEPRFLAFLHELRGLPIGLDPLIWPRKGAEADYVEHLGESPSCFPPVNLPTIRFTHQLKRLSKSPRRIEVIGKRIAEGIHPGHRSGPGAGGGVPRRSPAVVWGPLPRLPPSALTNRVLPKEVPQPLDPGYRFLHLLLPKSQRLPVVPRDQVRNDSVAPVAIERLRELEDVPLALRHLLRVGL